LVLREFLWGFSPKAIRISRTEVLFSQPNNIEKETKMGIGDSSNYSSDNEPSSNQKGAPITDEIRAEINSAWEDYDNANADVLAAKQTLKEMEEKRGAACKCISQLVQRVAPGKKKILRGGRQYTIVVRGPLYFFRGAKDEDTIDFG
jgi:hypothetical protein